MNFNYAAAEAYRAQCIAALRGFADRADHELTILLYHGVSDLPASRLVNYAGKHVSAADFSRDMRYVREHCAPLSMDEVVAIRRECRPWPRRAVAITFDDGFANNHHVAADIVLENRLPATFYVCAGMVDTRRMFWTDQLEDCLNRSSKQEISISFDGEVTRFALTGLGARAEALDTIKGYCKRVRAQQKDRIVADVIGETGITPSIDEWADYRVMSWSELREIADESLFAVGGHSLYHDILALQDERQSDLDVHATCALLEYNLRKPTRHFSYPEGQPHHYNAATVASLRREGVVCSPSAVCGTNPPGADLFHLRRIMVGFYGTPLPFLDRDLA